jgi:hypothetical protein
VIDKSVAEKFSVTRANEIAFIGRSPSLLHRKIVVKFIFNMIYVFLFKPEGRLLHRNYIVGRAAGVYLTLAVHRAAVKRQTQGDRGRGGTRVLGRICGKVGCRSVS